MGFSGKSGLLRGWYLVLVLPRYVHLNVVDVVDFYSSFIWSHIIATLLSRIRGRDSHVVGHLVECWICMHVINSSSLNNASYVPGCIANRQ